MPISVQNISNFTPNAQGILSGVAEPANLRRASKAGPVYLLASIAKSGTPQGNALQKYNATYGQILSCCTFHKNDFGHHLVFDENDIPSNFSSEGRTVLTQAAIIAETREKDLVSEDELFEVVAGYNGITNTSSKILDRLEIKREFLTRALNDCLIRQAQKSLITSAGISPVNVISL